MRDLDSTMINIRYFDELAEKKTSIHRLHPLAKIFVTMAYIVFVLSFDKYQITELLPFVFYPVILLGIAEIPFVKMLRKTVIVLPFLLGIGIFNLLYDRSIFGIVSGFPIYGGLVSFVTLSLKGILTILAAFCLIGSTSMEKIAAALRIIRIPRVFVTQLFLNYRYIELLLEEASSIWKGYSLRAPIQKGVKMKDIGHLMGQMLIRSFDRADRVYSAMKLRGFDGEYRRSALESLKLKSFLYMVFCLLLFLFFRLMNISKVMGDFMTGVLS